MNIYRPTDGYTEPGTWISYQDTDSIKAYTDYVKRMGINGAFAFDISMDDLNGFTLTNEIYNSFGDYSYGKHRTRSE